MSNYVFGADESDVYKQLSKLGVPHSEITFVDSLCGESSDSKVISAGGSILAAFGLGYAMGGWDKPRYAGFFESLR